MPAGRPRARPPAPGPPRWDSTRSCHHRRHRFLEPVRIARLAAVGGAPRLRRRPWPAGHGQTLGRTADGALDRHSCVYSIVLTSKYQHLSKNLATETTMTAPEGRPKLLRRPERRRALISAAARAFARNGFAATNLDGVAAELSVAAVLISRHFDSKADLYRAVLDDL